MGINTLSFYHSENSFTPEGSGFTIPTELATKIVEKLIRNGRVIRGFIGITARDLPHIRSNNNDINQIKGLRTFQVAANSPAENAGIQVGDIITSVNDQTVISAAETID